MKKRGVLLGIIMVLLMQTVALAINPSSTLTQGNVVSSMVLEEFNIPGFISMSNIALKKFGGIYALLTVFTLDDKGRDIL